MNNSDYTVKDLIFLLERLPPETKIYMVRMEKVYHVGNGDLMPLKVLEMKNQCAVYFDDNIGSHALHEAWQPLDEWAPNNFPVPSEIQ